MINRFFSYFLLSSVKYLSAVFYRYDINWLNDNLTHKQVDWSNIRLIVLLNHTSLFEPIFLRIVPNSFLWNISKNLVIPGADITMNRPILGKFFRKLVPGVVSITRKRDFTWSHFLSKIHPKAIVAILPEGRMKRADGLDKHGKEMSVRGGLADILEGFDNGEALFVYSGGLHHIQTPGQKIPRIFKKVKVNLEKFSIEKYKENLMDSDFMKFKSKIMDDLNHRLKNLTPK